VPLAGRALPNTPPLVRPSLFSFLSPPLARPPEARVLQFFDTLRTEPVGRDLSITVVFPGAPSGAHRHVLLRRVSTCTARL